MSKYFCAECTQGHSL